MTERESSFGWCQARWFARYLTTIHVKKSPIAVVEPRKLTFFGAPMNAVRIVNDVFCWCRGILHCATECDTVMTPVMGLRNYSQLPQSNCLRRFCSKLSNLSLQGVDRDQFPCGSAGCRCTQLFGFLTSIQYKFSGAFDELAHWPVFVL